MHLACQLRPWIQTLGPEEFARELPVILRTVSGISFTGFETALPALLSVDAGTLRQWQADTNGIAIAAAHTGARWWDLPAPQLDALLGDLERLTERGGDRLAVSIGKEIVDCSDADIRHAGETLATLAERAPVEIVIHNHWWEIADDCRVLRAILAAAEGSPLRLGPDLGWVVHAGADPVAFVHEFAPLIAYTHVRDYADRGFIEIGRGAMSWPSLIAALHEIGYTDWLTAESEFNDLWCGDPDPATSARLQFAGLATVVQE
ncbi:MAG: TIM barrel protein [Thermomicrobiales bacterium]